MAERRSRWTDGGSGDRRLKEGNRGSDQPALDEGEKKSVFLKGEIIEERRSRVALNLILKHSDETRDNERPSKLRATRKR